MNQESTELRSLSLSLSISHSSLLRFSPSGPLSSSPPNDIDLIASTFGTENSASDLTLNPSLLFADFWKLCVRSELSEFTGRENVDSCKEKVDERL